MKKRPLHLTFRHALKQYKRYKRKYSKLFQAGTSIDKLDFLKKRIARLKDFLLQGIQKSKLATAAGALALVLSSSAAEAQTFNAPVANAFGMALSSPTFAADATTSLLMDEN